MSLEDHDLPPRVLHHRDQEQSLPEWKRIALLQREEARAAARRKADELAAIEEFETSGAAWDAVLAAQAKDTDSDRVHWPHPTNVDRRMFGGQVGT